MTDEQDELKRELEEIRTIKESLREELEELKREKEWLHKVRTESERRGPPLQPPHRPPPPHEPHIGRAPPMPPHGPRTHHHPGPSKATIIDLEALAESLEDMMSGLGEQIRMAMSSIRPIDIRVRDFRTSHAMSKSRIKSRAKRRKKVEAISPDRIARILSPLGNVERLRILDYLKDGTKTFNDIESYIGKTGSSLTHHLSPLIEAGYVVKGEVRGTYYITISGRLAYRLAQWLTSQVEREQSVRSEENLTEEDDSIEDIEESVSNEIVDEDEEFDLSPDSEEEDVW